MGENPLKWFTGPIRRRRERRQERQEERQFLNLKREFSLLAEEAADAAADRLAVKEEYGSIVQEVAEQAIERHELKETKTEIVTEVADIFAERTTERQTLFHLLKGNIGAGCLSLPWSFSQLGIPLGVMATFSIAFWTYYNCMTLLEVKQKHTSNHRTITYSDLGEVAYGRHFRTFVTGSIVLLQMAICTVFLSFVGGNSLAFFQDISPDLPFLGQSEAWSIIVVTPVVIAITLIPNFKALGPISEIAMLVLFAAFALLAVVLADNLPNHGDMDGLGAEHPAPTRIPPTFDWKQAPMAVCGILYSFEGICIVLPLEASMKDRSSFSSLFSWTYLGVAVLYATIGVACVGVLGKVQDGSITSYLMSHADDYNGYMLVTISNSLASIAVLFTYALTMFPCIELWCQAKERRDRGDTLEPLEEDEEDWWGGELAYGPYDTPLLRLSLVFATVVMAIAIPNVTELIGLAGAIAGAATALIVPPMLALHFTDEDYPGFTFRKVQEYFLLGLGVLFGIVGAAASLYDIYTTMIST